MTVAAIIVAAGSGTRMSDGGPAKQYRLLAGRTVLARATEPFLRHPLVDRVLLVTREGEAELCRTALGGLASHPKLLRPATGGATRQATVRNGLAAIGTEKPHVVLIHDAARPFVSAGAIGEVIAAVTPQRGAIAATRLTDTLKRSDASGAIIETIPRQDLWRAQTPQGFSYEPIVTAHARAQASGRDDFTDDAAIAEWAGMTVTLIECGPANLKITEQEDMDMARARLSAPDLPDVRTGQGFDVHRLVPGDHVWLCGIRIPHTSTLEGHSDADVGMHAATDALLGTISDADIGEHFKNTDPRWRGARSAQFLADAARRVTDRGGRISNIDVTLLCEAPKVAPHRREMCAAIAQAAGIAADRVSVKATTTEGLGFPGRREGIAALATATVVFPSSAIEHPDAPN